MKKIIFCFSFLIVLCSFCDLSAQRAPVITDIFCEDFDAEPSMWGLRIDSFPSTNDSSWVRDTVITATPTSFGSGRVQVGRVNASSNPSGFRSGDRLTTPNMYIDTFVSVAFSFDHICYLADADAALVEYSFNGGATWARVPLANYNGRSIYDKKLPGVPGPPDLRFSKTSQPTKWQVASNNFVWTPGNSAGAWERENFDITTLIDNRNPKPDSVMLRLAAYDPLNSPVGPQGNHFWWVDNFCVTGGDCDLVPPTLDLLPPVNYPGVDKYDERVYLDGPWIFDTKVRDNKGQVSEVYVAYWLLREDIPGARFDTIYNDTIALTLQAGVDYSGRIEPFYDPNDPTARIVPGDSIIWKIDAFDGSACRNGIENSPNGKFQVRPKLPPSCNSDPVFSFPYVEDFNSTDWSSAPNNETTMVNGWKNASGDFEEWRVTTGQSSQDSTPFKIFDDFPGGGNYVRIESGTVGNFLNGKLAYLNSPCFDFTELRNGTVRFYLNMNTAGLEDSIQVDIYDPTPVTGAPNGKFIKNVIPVVKGAKGNNWLPYEFSILPYRNFVTQIRFGGTAGRPDGLGDMGLDSFRIAPAPELDLRMNSVNLKAFVPYGAGGVGNGEDALTVNIQNIGVNTESNFEVFYEVFKLNDDDTKTSFGGPFTETFSGGIPAASNQDYTFTQKYTVPKGRFEVKAWLKHTPDIFHENDTSFATSNGIPVVSGKKYMDNFDEDTAWTVFSREDSLTNKWELGTPNYDFTYSAYSPPNSWDILLDRAYTGTGGIASLVSPFMNFSNVDDAILSFINNRDIDTTQDGVFIEFSLNRGDSWTVIEGTNDPDKLKWNNSFLSSEGFGGFPVLSGKTYCFGNTWNGFLETEVKLPVELNFKPEVLLRFNFITRQDNDGNDGISIDNILVYDPEPLDLQVQHFVGPTSRCNLQQDQRIETIVKNRGLNTVNSFNIHYIITHLPTMTVYDKVDVVNRTIGSRDTVHIRSASTFDMNVYYGDYDVQVIAELPGDLCTENDTLRKLVENVDGCSLQFYIETSFRPNFQQPCDSSVWKFNYTSGGRSYEISEPYNSPKYPINLPLGVGLDTIKDLYVCIKDDSKVTFRLDDTDTLVDRYSFVAYNGSRDIVLYDEVSGGPDSPTQRFNWICPPQRSATPIGIHLDDDLVQLPLPQNYVITVDVLNNGLDSLDSVKVYFQIDNLTPVERHMKFPNPNVLRYTKVKTQGFGPQFIAAGDHVLRAWTRFPNGQQDLKVEDDTLEILFTAMSTVNFEMDTMPVGGGSNIIRETFCDDFEDSEAKPWIAANPYTLSQLNNTFEFGTPNSTNISGANSGSNAWVTNLDGTYKNQDEGMLISPFFSVSKDSCYKVSFSHNYHITDDLHDGGTVRFLLPNSQGSYDDEFWSPLGKIVLRDTLIDIIGSDIVPADTVYTSTDTIITPADTVIYYDTTIIDLDTIIGLGDTIYTNQVGWYNTRHILSIPDNSRNAGWSGVSNGWTTASALLIPKETYNTALIWRFESDGSNVSDGWAIDDFCVEKLPPTSCYPVSTGELLFEKDELYLGQNIPNPATYSTIIPFYLPKSGMVQFEVINLLGQPVYRENVSRPKGDGIIDLDLSTIAKGVYYYTLTLDGNRATNKMVISK